MANPPYCDLTPEINSVPRESEMTPYKPYFVIPDGCDCFDIYIKVNECYALIAADEGIPAGGACTTGDEYNFLIKIDKEAGCTGTNDKVISHTVDFRQDDEGHKMYFYVEDVSAGGSVKGGSLTKNTVQK